MMHAVRYHGAGKLSLDLIPIPKAAAGVVVEVKAAALCHTDLQIVDGTLDLGGVKPMTLGHGAAGVIVEVGEGVDPKRIGERVFVYYYVGCGACRWCGTGDLQLCGSKVAQFGFISDGALAKYLAAPARNAVRLPSEALSFEAAAPMGCGVMTAVHAVKRAGGLKSGESVVVYGCNGLGQGLVQLAKHYGCFVIAVARQQGHRDKALALGADVAIDGTDASTVAAAVRANTGGDGADVVFECVGSRETLDACVGWAGALGKRGRLVLLGYRASDAHELRAHPIPIVVYEQCVVGSAGATMQDLEEALSLVENGFVSTVVDSTIHLADFQRLGLDKLRNSECTGKIVVNNFDVVPVVPI